MSLKNKIKMSLLKINQYFNRLDGQAYVSYSGGKDSTVLLHMVKRLYPDVEIVYVNTGLEYPEINYQVSLQDNVTIIRPKRNFSEVLDRWGYPVISKEVSKNISRYRNTKHEWVRQYRKYGIKRDGSKGKAGVIPKKWWAMIDAPFKISDMCCYQLKINPIKKYEKLSGLKPVIGTMVTDSLRRKFNYLKYGCNVFGVKNISSRPLSFWTEKDIWNYIRKFKVNYCSIYDKGESNTGCIFCLFGIHLEKEPNRLQRMRLLHPKLYSYCIDNLGIGEVLDYMEIPY